MRKTHVADGTLQTLYPKPWRPGVDLLKQATPDSVEYDVYRNAVIKGFELVLETGGKLLGKYLKQFFSSPAEVDRLYFKDVLRHTAKHGLLTPDEVRRCFFYRDNRNLTAHDYGETPAEEALRLKPS